MSTAAVMLVKDEADILGYTLDHLATQVDAIYVADNNSTDGTEDVIQAFRQRILDEDLPVDFSWSVDEEVGYWQSEKTTRLAMRALDAGHSWVVPCDADEWWYATDGRTIAQFLAGQVPDTLVVRADMFNHFPTPLDDQEQQNPFARIGWRHRERQSLGKVACRLRDDLVIEAGNHSARYESRVGGGRYNTGGGLVVRHYSWRSEEQYVRKIRNGSAAYAATDLPEGVGTHWRMWDGHTDEDIAVHYREFFVLPDPLDSDDFLIYDPIV